MRLMMKTGIVLSAAAILSACETIVEVPIPKHTPQLALHYMVGNDKPDSAFYTALPSYQPFVSHSQSILSNEDLAGLSDANLVLTDASGKVVETFTNDAIMGNGYYQPVSRFVAQPGQTYTLTVSAPGFETVTSTQTLPGLVAGLQATYVQEGTEKIGNDGLRSYGKLSLTLPDNGNEKNYYVLYAVLLDGQYQNHTYDVFVENRSEEDEDLGIQPEFQDVHYSDSRYDTPQPFDDSGFNGRTITITRDVNLYYGDVYKAPRYLRVMLHSITADTYRFLKSFQTYNQSSGNIFSEPVRVVGNINKGYGYFGAYTSSVSDLKLH